MRLRRTVIATFAAAAIAVPTLATAALASTPTPATATVAASATAAKSSDKSSSKPSEKSSGKPTAKPTKTAKRALFAATGTVTSVDATAGTITLYAKGGTKDVRKKTITVTVADDALIRVNGKRGAGLSSIAAGFRIDVGGRRSGSDYTAEIIIAKGKVRATPSPTVSPKPSPTVSPSISPSPSVEPSESTEPGDDDDTSPSAEPGDDSQ
ncbi:hypothetical protein GCM10010435_66790 [Winogradskya consettensis]|uniref:Uncharacterized protein n=1 Tax=Winogradskya consettensis TaxID=113560 RepID=A0A919SLI8_9ACTN|nr:hypothetical protein [Actinoplanes consettensis]GIM73949.1 hypothetical protein Aco04nite_37970 [Actinoplanes consettensis]